MAKLVVIFFHGRDTKLDLIMATNQNIQRKLLYIIDRFSSGQSSVIQKCQILAHL